MIDLTIYSNGSSDDSKCKHMESIFIRHSINNIDPLSNGKGNITGTGDGSGKGCGTLIHSSGILNAVEGVIIKNYMIGDSQPKDTLKSKL